MNATLNLRVQAVCLQKFISVEFSFVIIFFIYLFLFIYFFNFKCTVSSAETIVLFNNRMVNTSLFWMFNFLFHKILFYFDMTTLPLSILSFFSDSRVASFVIIPDKYLFS